MRQRAVLFGAAGAVVGAVCVTVAATVQLDFLQAGVQPQGFPTEGSGAMIRRYSCDASGPIEEHVVTVQGWTVRIAPVPTKAR